MSACAKCNALSAKQRILFVIVVVNLLILALYQGFFSSFYSPIDIGFVDPRVRNQIRTFVIKAGERQSLQGVDVHLEDPVLGHTGHVSDGHAHVQLPEAERQMTIAIGGGITSKGVKGATKTNVAQKFQLFFTLLPSFCKTASTKYIYHFYLAYDQNDDFFKNMENLVSFQQAFTDTCHAKCPKNLKPSLHLVQCNHNGRPAWAQNDAMLEAYFDNVEYFYRVNDDSDLSSGGWTEAFVSTLAKYNPANVGVVGPKHRGGNEAILTYDFVHRTHVDIFGFYYPRTFPDWWADDWVTKVYQPGRSTKLSSIRLTHTMKLGQRYTLQSTKNGNKLQLQLETDKKTLNRYIKYAEKKEDFPKPDGRKVIAMSLYGMDTLYTYGAVRNAQLLPLVFPGWSLRFYVPGPNSTASLVVPPRILDKLRFLNAQIAYVKEDTRIPPQYWRYLVADDRNVTHFLVRDADARLGDREFSAVQAWEDTAASFHTIRDHPAHASQPLVEGLWGARAADLRKLLKFPMLDALNKDLSGLKAVLNTTADDGELTVLNHVIWPLVQRYTLSHDSVSCWKWPSAQPFPVGRASPRSYIGQRYDARMNAVWTDSKDLSASSRCVGEGTGNAQFPELPEVTPGTPETGTKSPPVDTAKVKSPEPKQVAPIVSNVKNQTVVSTQASAGKVSSAKNETSRVGTNKDETVASLLAIPSNKTAVVSEDAGKQLDINSNVHKER